MQTNKHSEILINSGLNEIRLALLENSILQEIYIERRSQVGIVGNIYKGKVERVLPGMDAAFIDIGLEKNAFLHVKNITQGKNISTAKTAGGADAGVDAKQPAIGDFVRQDEAILVQVIKDPLGNKGARLTTDISIPSRYVVFLPNARGIGISNRIEDETVRQFLRERIAQFSDGLPGGYIVRTAIENTDAWALNSDIQYLHKIWRKITEQYQHSKAGTLIYEGLPLHLRCLRDLVDESVVSIRVDSPKLVKEMQTFLNDFFPDSREIVQCHHSERPIFDLYSIEDEIGKALERKVHLKSGGYIIIDQTEAMTTIDVNTGRFVGADSHSNTVFKTNLEATKVIARQLRLRNLGGIIIIDFIDMDSHEHEKAVVNCLTEAMDKTYSRYSIDPWSSLGLLQMTRKRTRESLQHILCECCPTCGGRGKIKTIETIAYEIMRDVMREVAMFKPQDVMIICAHEMNDYLGDDEPDILADLADNLQLPIRLKTDSYYSREQYDIALY